MKDGKLVFVLPDYLLKDMNCTLEEFQKENPSVIVTMNQRIQ